jgi:hypothetical protein
MKKSSSAIPNERSGQKFPTKTKDKTFFVGGIGRSRRSNANGTFVRNGGSRRPAEG